MFQNYLVNSIYYNTLLELNKEFIPVLVEEGGKFSQKGLIEILNSSLLPYHELLNSFKNGGGIRLTISKYYLPSGKSISEVGVSPDIEIYEELDNFIINSETDNQLNYAIKLLNG